MTIKQGRHLAVIDMQRVFAEPASPWFTPRFAEVVEPIRRLVTAFGGRVTFTRFVAPEVPAGAWQRYYEQWPFALQPPDAPIYELADGMTRGDDPPNPPAPHSGSFAPARTLDATTFGKWGPELAGEVGDGGLVLAGVSTDCCVLSTALAAADAGVPVQVVADACAGVNDETHRQALDIMRLYAPLVEVVTLSDVL